MKQQNSFLTTLKNRFSSHNCYSALIVDDYNPAKQMIGSSLSSMPQIGKIEYASSGEEALLKVRRNQYDLIYLDVTMPGIDGFETCKRIRDMPGYDMTPIVMVTGNQTPQNEFKGAVSGCTSYVNKPIKHEHFRRLNQRMFSWLEEIKAA